jgi:hypothetical protein
VSDFAKQFGAMFLALVLGGVVLAVLLVGLACGGVTFFSWRAESARAAQEAAERKMIEADRAAQEELSRQYDLAHPGWREEMHRKEIEELGKQFKWGSEP